MRLLFFESVEKNVKVVLFPTAQCLLRPASRVCLIVIDLEVLIPFNIRVAKINHASALDRIPR